MLRSSTLAASKSKRRAPARVRSLPTIAEVALILLAGLTAYSNSFSGVFVLDDEPALAQNPTQAE